MLLNQIVNLRIWVHKNPETLRIASILASIYHVLLSHVFMFVTLLGLIHAEATSRILLEDIEDQRDREDYALVPINQNGVSMNSIRFKSATRLAEETLYMLYMANAVAGLYLLCSLGLLFGSLKNVRKLMIPWILFDITNNAACVAALTYIAITRVLTKCEYSINGTNDACFLHTWYFGLLVYWTLDLIAFAMIITNYVTLRFNSRIPKHIEATISLPFPTGPRRFAHPAQSSMHQLGGLKHELTDAEFNYVA